MQLLKRIIAMLLCLLTLAAVLPVTASAENVAALCERIEEEYKEALLVAERDTFGGHCGELASWQLYLTGINEWFSGADGNKQYDKYCEAGSTSGGYRITAYGADKYTLEEALNEATKNGVYDVYNIMVGFEWTSTEAGNIYGHAVFVYGIIDGIVYFTESFTTSMGTKEGEAIRISVAEFVDYYDDWTVFDGIIVFGQKGYESTCKRYASDIFVEVTADQSLMSQPCDEKLTWADSKPMRLARKGEHLVVTGLIENTKGEFYYRVDDTGTTCYIAAQAVMPLRFNYEQIKIEKASMPVALDLEEDFDLGGLVVSKRGAFGVVHVEVTDINNRVILNYSLESERSLYDLSSYRLNANMDFGVLEKGYYSCNVYADGINYYVHNGQLTADRQRVCVLSHPFKVGKKLPAYEKPSTIRQMTHQNRNGWYWEENTWRYYEKDQPCSGWVTYKGIDYYLKEDGSITTGLSEVDGVLYFFTCTGAKLVGWLETGQGKRYLMPDGASAIGWQIIDGKKYFFGPKGIMIKECWFSQSKDLYYLQSDGSAAVGQLRLSGKTYMFRADGRLRMLSPKPDQYYVESDFA